MLHISISAEPLFNIGPLIVTNSLLTTWLTMGLLITVILFTTNNLSVIPKSVSQNLWEMMIEFFEDLTNSIAGVNKGKFFFPLATSLFLFILLMNWIGLLPGVGTIGLHESKHETVIIEADVVNDNASYQTDEDIVADEHGESESALVPFFRAGTADLNTTLALAIIAMIAVQYYGIKNVGWKDYLSKFINFKGPIEFFVGILELISEFAKIISFAFRLFGNIFAGEVLLVVIMFLIPVILPIPFLGMELFVGLIQAFVFAMLTLVFLSIATEKHSY